MKIISRKEATARGLKRYFTGKPCRNGHLAHRYIDGRCARCVITNQSKELRWRQNHSENGKERRRRWKRERYRYGPSNPEGEKQWLEKNAAQVRALKRLLREPQKASQLLSEASKLGLNLPV